MLKRPASYFLFGAVLLMWVLAADAFAADLHGRVVDAKNRPKGFVSIDLFGPKSRRKTTDENGVFIFESLPPGQYRVRIRQKPHRQEFSLTLPNNGKHEETFTVEW